MLPEGSGLCHTPGTLDNPQPPQKSGGPGSWESQRLYFFCSYTCVLQPARINHDAPPYSITATTSFNPWRRPPRINPHRTEWALLWRWHWSQQVHNRVPETVPHPAFWGRPELFSQTSPSPRPSYIHIPNNFLYPSFLFQAMVHFKFPDHTTNIFMFAFAISVFAWVLNSVSPMSFISRLLQVTNARACNGDKGCPHKELGREGRQQVTGDVPAKGCFTLAQRSINRSHATVWSLPEPRGECTGEAGGFKLAQTLSGCIWQFLSKLQVHLPFDSTIPLPKIYLHAYIFTYTHMQAKKLTPKVIYGNVIPHTSKL